MQRSRKDVKLLLQGILVLLSFACLGCSLFKPAPPPPPVLMPESIATPLEKGEPAPFAGWLLSDSGLLRLMETAEKAPKP